MKNEFSMQSQTQTHSPHPDRFQNTLIGKMAEIVNGSMMLFHSALELHWNYQGPNFLGVHQFLDAHYQMLLKHFDNVAERAVTLGGTMKLNMSTHGQDQSYREFNVDHYLTEAEGFCERLKAAVKSSEEDDVTHDLLTNYLGALEKDLWQLRSTLGQAVDVQEGPKPSDMVQ